MAKLTGWMRWAVAGLALLAMAGCASTSRYHGYVPSDEDLAQIEVGRDTTETVAEKIGRPGSTGLLRGGGWYYVQSEWEQFGWREPREIDREVVAIQFNERGTVSNVERYGLADGQVVALSRRVTDPQSVSPFSILSRIFGTIGNFNPGALLPG